MAPRVLLHRSLGLGSRGYDVDGAKRSVYKFLSRHRGRLWSYYLGQTAVGRRFFGITFGRHCEQAKNRLGVKRGKPRQFDQYLLNALYEVDAVDWLCEHLLEMARPSQVCPIPAGVSYSIIGYPNQGTHRASDWQSRNALDWKAPSGTKVLSPISGICRRVGGSNGIRYVGNKIIFGRKLTIDPQNGAECLITHLADLRVSEGQLVRAGDVLGVIGSYGPGSHAHISLQWGSPQAMLSWSRLTV